jgi:HEPN domain-containing protein
MTSDEMARGHLRRAATVLREAERLYEEKAWNLVVRRCQEAVEFSREFCGASARRCRRFTT